MNVLVEQSIPSGAKVNLMQGQQYEFLPGDSEVQIGITGQAAGLVAEVFADSTLVQQEGPVLVKAGAFPSIQDELYIDEMIAGGVRLSINVRNTTGAAIVARLVVRMLPLG